MELLPLIKPFHQYDRLYRFTGYSPGFLEKNYDYGEIMALYTWLC
jgi:hypothetical protein